jgi:hypothetical protein
MAELFIYALLGHFIGDYVLQTKYMAHNKSVSGWCGPGWSGITTCSIHTLIYTASVCLMMWTFNPVIWILVFVPHWVIDRWSLATPWLKLIKGRTRDAAYYSEDRYREFDIAFTSVVYAVVDNTFHLLSLLVVIELFLA